MEEYIFFEICETSLLWKGRAESQIRNTGVCDPSSKCFITQATRNSRIGLTDHFSALVETVCVTHMDFSILSKGIIWASELVKEPLTDYPINVTSFQSLCQPPLQKTLPSQICFLAYMSTIKHPTSSYSNHCGVENRFCAFQLLAGEHDFFPYRSHKERVMAWGSAEARPFQSIWHAHVL